MSDVLEGEDTAAETLSESLQEMLENGNIAPLQDARLLSEGYEEYALSLVEGGNAPHNGLDSFLVKLRGRTVRVTLEDLEPVVPVLTVYLSVDESIEDGVSNALDELGSHPAIYSVVVGERKMVQI